MHHQGKMNKRKRRKKEEKCLLHQPHESASPELLRLAAIQSGRRMHYMMVPLLAKKEGEKEGGKKEGEKKRASVPV